MANDADDKELASYVDVVSQALAEEDQGRVVRIINRLHPAETADLLEALPPDERTAVWQLTPSEVKGDILLETAGEVRQQLIGETGAADLVTAVERLDLDELADLYDELPAQVTEAVVQAMGALERRRFAQLKAYPEDSAGGLMDIDAVAVRADVTLDVVLRYLRAVRRRVGRLPEAVDTLIVVDPNNHYLGLLLLSDLVSLEPDKTVSEVMNRDIEPIPASTTAARVARLFQDRDLVSAAVVDDDGILLGRITVDDVIDVIRDEADQDVMGRAGLSRETDMFAPLTVSARRRGVWLGVNLINTFIAALVIGQFESTIQQIVAVAVLMPVVASMGGVAGTQTLTLVTRGIALEQVARANAGQLFAKELGVSLLNGVLLAVVVAVIAQAWFDNATLALTFAIALIINLINGAAAGTLIPLALSRLGVDPAIAGGVVLTAATDVIGFFSFLGLATLFLL